jgi:protein ImuA
MSGQPKPPIPEALETVKELRERLGLFSFRFEGGRSGPAVLTGSWPELDLRPGMVVEWLATRPGAGAATSALRILSRHLGGRGVWAVVDPLREAYVPAVSGWGINPSRVLLLRPATLRETCWAVEQCLRCPGVAATCAWVQERLTTTVNRRWKLAAEVGGGVCSLFRPDSARREPAWADLRLRVTPLSGDQGDLRRIRVDVLYRRGGLGGSAQVWEIDHAAGDVRLVPEVANPTIAGRAARA